MRDFRITYLGGLCEVNRILSRIRIDASPFKLVFAALYLCERLFLVLPFEFQFAGGIAQIGYLFLDRTHAGARLSFGALGLFFERFTFYFKTYYFPVRFFESRRLVLK